MQSELRPASCPFCGSNNTRAEVMSHGWAVYFNECEAEGPPRERRTDAIAAWNRRAPEGEEK